MLVRFTKILVLTLTLILFRPAVANSSDMQFNMSISVMTGLVVNTTKNLVFPDGMITGATQLLTVAPADAGAAIFSAQGRKIKGYCKYNIGHRATICYRIKYHTNCGSVHNNGTG